MRCCAAAAGGKWDKEAPPQASKASAPLPPPGPPPPPPFLEPSEMTQQQPTGKRVWCVAGGPRSAAPCEGSTYECYQGANALQRQQQQQAPDQAC